MNTPDVTEQLASGNASAPVSGSLPASSVEKLLKKWRDYQADWQEAERYWRSNQKTLSDAVRLNCCRVRATLLGKIIKELRAELAATNKRQPEENSSSMEKNP